MKSRAPRHADRLRRDANRCGFEERFKNANHTFSRPAVVAGGVGGGDVRWFCGGGDDGGRDDGRGGAFGWGCHLVTYNQMGLRRKGVM